MEDSDRKLLQETCAAEATELLDLLEQGLLALEQDPSDPETLGALFRAAHTLKGTAVVLGYAHVGALAHVLEDVLERLSGGALALTADTLTLLFDGTDGLREAMDEALAGRDAPSGLVPRFEAFLAGENSESSALRARTASAGAHREARTSRWHRVSAAKLDRVLDLMGEFAVARNGLGAVLDQAAPDLERVREAHRDAEQLALRLQEELFELRMVPVGSLFRPHARTVRDLARSKGKQARLVIEGAEVEVDATVAEAVRDPLLHLVRNAVDHGLEAPAAREARGKGPVGTVTLRGWHEQGRVMISLSDDGAGFDRGRILRRARQLGLVGAEETPADAALDRLIFTPGFSTAAKVDEVSGRGVGMDVVKRNIEALRGAVRVQTWPGQGTSITLSLPLTLAIIEGFSVELGAQTYVLPLEAVEECVEFPREQQREGRQRGVLNLRGQALPWVRPHQRLQVTPGTSERESLVVVRCSAGRAGLVVDRLLGAGQAVIKPLPPGVTDAPGLAGSSLQGDGRVALIVDVEGLLAEELGGLWSPPTVAAVEEA